MFFWYSAIKRTDSDKKYSFENQQGGRIMKTIAILICLSIFMGSNAYAEQSGSNLGPPPAAYAACKIKKAGDSASFVNPKGETITGTCEQEGNQLVLRPDHSKGQPGGKRQGPPPEAYRACEGKSAGSAAQFINRRGETIKGTCTEDNGKMVLRPDSNKGNKSTKIN
jgi:hypothetical protein